jgi:hypothetical protein
MVSSKKKIVASKKKIIVKKPKKAIEIPSENTNVEDFIPLVLPSDNTLLENYVTKNKMLLMDKVISSIEYAVNNNLHIAEVFKFDKSDYVITVSRQQFKQNVERIYNFYVENEIYERCKRVAQLIKVLNEK